MGYKVAVVGATGNVGREMLSILDEREFPIDEIHAVASRRSLGVEVSFGDKVKHQAADYHDARPLFHVKSPECSRQSSRRPR